MTVETEGGGVRNAQVRGHGNHQP
ncbi:Hypothetical protein PFREUD_23480 [Propionibacterium freudenreichii subsp. shermanii CIRM-BIA1]|uniref:Uncharacterized protein n=1 Tax=Propionibacterium freudenreichii subsp. shermanii (strain ATCC 9614 / DSM 4902 / CIP 103027 / NCIMB 8099 / CIRM-BIA1) TaxID=754252 RepID=D7GH51_PROFC|nr:Hypothetical protein PFREUD_23480 [Propionibacterium freudenreichii subsp. shermanii CIRM-BIA1]